jgi:hypothetical protein
LIIGLNKTTIKVELTNDYSNCFYGSYADNLFKEGIKRAGLAHVLKYSKALTIKDIELFISNSTSIWAIEEVEPLKNFQNMITGKLKLPKRMGNLQLLRTILKINKTQADVLYASLYSYIYSFQQDNEYERFMYYWIAINGMYSFVGGRTDKDAIGNLAEQLGIGRKPLTKANRDKVGPKICRLLSEQDTRLSREKLNNDRDLICVHIKEILNNIEQEDYDMTVYGLLVLDIAYYLRCKYFHAKSPILLFGFTSDFERKVLVEKDK